MHYDPTVCYQMSVERQREDHARADRDRLVRAAVAGTEHGRRWRRWTVQRAADALEPIIASTAELGIRDTR
ncbi:MAG: hypothetical protein ACR2PK_03180 [Acidimicrobiales bacterium]